MGGLKAMVKVTCKEVQPSAFLATSTSMECIIDMMGFKAEASYLASVHYECVETVGGFRMQEQKVSKANSCKNHEQTGKGTEADKRTLCKRRFDNE